MSRRISRLRTEPPDRQPVLIVGALLLGLTVGLIAVPRLVGGMDGRAENYLVLASTLFQQGEPPTLLRDRLTSVGITQPASAVLSVAQRYSASRDKKQQHQAESLDAFGKVLLNPDAAAPTPTATVAPPASPVSGAAPLGTPGALGTVTTLSTPIAGRPTGTGPAPVGTPGAPPAGTPGLAPAPGTVGTPPAGLVPVGTPGAGQAAAAQATPAGTPGAIQRGRVRPPDGGSARLRNGPTTDGGTLSLIPNAAQVEILETVRGQAVEGETRWLRVRYGSLTGYISAKLVVVGE